MSIVELCLVVITVSIVALVVQTLKTLSNVNRTLDNVHGITTSIHEKTKAVDEFFSQMKELEGIVKYAKIGLDVAKNLKNKDKKTVVLKRSSATKEKE